MDIRYNQNMPLVSVLMPCYNAEETLPEALESLVSQTLPDFEVIAVDDGSSDASPEILRRWELQVPRFRVLTQPHAGIVRALKRGLAACRAPLIARMDADDRSHPCRLEKQVRYLETHPAVALVSCLVRGYQPGRGLGPGFVVYIEWLNSLVSDADIRREIFIESPLVHPSILIRREWLDRAGGYQDCGWAEDYDLWLRLYLAGTRFAKVPEVLLDWRESPQRLTRRDPRYSLENFLRAKAHYLARGPLQGKKALFIWGAGMTGRRLSKHLLRQGLPLAAFIDIDPKKIGRTLRGLPILAPEDLLPRWDQAIAPALLVTVGARGAKRLIREFLGTRGLVEGCDWWCAA